MSIIKIELVTFAQSCSINFFYSIEWKHIFDAMKFKIPKLQRGPNLMMIKE